MGEGGGGLKRFNNVQAAFGLCFSAFGLCFSAFGLCFSAFGLCSYLFSVNFRFVIFLNCFINIHFCAKTITWCHITHGKGCIDHHVSC